MPDHEHTERTFDAIRQFVIAPDRRYRVESSGATLRFSKTGSQFDAQWLVRGARSVLGDRIADAFERSSRTKLIIGGLGLAAVSVILLLLAGAWVASTAVPLRRSHFTGIGVLVFAFIVGLIMIVAGMSSQGQKASRAGHDFTLALTDIADVTLLPAQSELARRGEPQVARLHLQPRSGRAIRLGIPSDTDLATVKSVIPQLAA